VNHGPGSWALGIIGLLTGLFPLSAGSQPLRFAPLPLEDAKILYEQIGGLIDFVSERAGVTIDWVQFPDYAQLIAAFSAGELDLAYLGPLPIAILQRDYGQLEPLGCFRDLNGAPSYTCSLIAFADDQLRPEAIAGKHIGLTQPYSTCGWLAVSEMLRAAGRRLDSDGNRFSYAGSHSKAALGVAQGRFDVAGVKTSIAQRYAHLNLEPIAQSQRWPGFSLVANTATLSAPQIARLRAAMATLEHLEQQPVLAERASAWGPQVRQGVVPPERCDYASVAAALDQLPWPSPSAGIETETRPPATQGPEDIPSADDAR
jgi:phosphonate transport system substrate-binding protein